MTSIKLHKKIPVFVLLFLLIPFFSFEKHEEYYSLTNLQYKESEKTLEITMRFFTNDMEFALQKYYSKTMELGTDREPKDMDELIQKYLELKCSVLLDGKPKYFRWVGKEFDKDAVYIYLKINDVEDFRKIDILNSALIEAFPTQENIVKVKAYNSYKSLVLNKLNPRGTLNF